ncbi:MAG: hypothetical protein WDO74_01450 [Pseudomonadota bacterium]
MRMRSMRSCARPLRAAIERRARADDDVAAELTLILLEMHAAEQAQLLNRYARSPSGAWRAVAARAAQGPIDADMRKAFFVDPDERVRRAAFATALDVRDAGELEALLEAARVDPDPQSQSLAIRAAGAIGGERAVLSLKDLWARGGRQFAHCHRGCVDRACLVRRGWRRASSNWPPRVAWGSPP